MLGDLQRFFLLFNLEYSSAICIILIERGKTEDAAALIKDHIFIQLTFEFSSFTILRSPLNQKNLGLSALVNHIIVRIVCPVVRTTKYQHIKIQNCFKMFCDQMLHQGPQASSKVNAGQGWLGTRPSLVVAVSDARAIIVRIASIVQIGSTVQISIIVRIARIVRIAPICGRFVLCGRFVQKTAMVLW